MLTIRAERPEDRAGVRRVNGLAFGRPAEADLVDALRDSATPLISLIAEQNGEVVGHVLFTPVTLESGGTVDAAPGLILGLAPLAVLPECQNQGIGSQLVRRGLEACREHGAVGVIVLGHPEYYPRFGFGPASRFGLTCEYPVPDDVFMALELTPGPLVHPGLVRYHPAFSTV